MELVLLVPPDLEESPAAGRGSTQIFLPVSAEQLGPLTRGFEGSRSACLLCDTVHPPLPP